MRIGRLVWVCLVLLLSLSSWGQNSPSSFHVIENKMRYRLDPGRVNIAIESQVARAITAHLHLEALWPDDRIAARFDGPISIQPGEHAFEEPLDIDAQGSSSISISDLYWCRLRYRIVPEANSGLNDQEGIVQLGRIMHGAFGLQAFGLRRPQRGSSFPLRVHVGDPNSGKGQSGFEVQAQLRARSDDAIDPAPVRARTDRHGDATLIMSVPATAESDATIEITAQRGEWKDSQSVELDLSDALTGTLSTDKPIYQPGQTLHMRTLILGPDRRALANAQVKITIEDEQGEEQFARLVNTSRFGIAKADWEIPEKARIGSYHIKVADEDINQITESVVRVSRYELPEFTVNPSPDRSYYLPGERPRIEVEARYLFGQPVSRAQVRIVRDENPQDNNEKPEGETPADEAQGELDASGKFTATLDLSKDFDQLGHTDYRRFTDIRFAAYVNDASTHRTEQKHFTVRLSKDRIHLYLLTSAQSSGERVDFYINSAYPDGTAASAEVRVSVLKLKESSDPADPRIEERIPIAHVHTNRFGVAHVGLTRRFNEFLSDMRSGYSHMILLLEADDHHGGHGVHREDAWLEDTPFLRITPVKRLLRPGENIIAEIDSSLGDRAIFVDLLGDNAVLGSARVQLHDGRAGVEFPYDQKFRNSIHILASALRASEEQQSLTTMAEVLYPEPQELDLGVHLQRSTYKPGEPASARFSVQSSDRKPVESALGVVIYDKAVAERVRSDEEFGGQYGFSVLDDSADHYPVIDGTGYRDLLNRKLATPPPGDLELLAEAILVAGESLHSYRTFVEGDETYFSSPAEVFHGLIDRDLNRTQAALRLRGIPCSEFPRNLEQLRKALADVDIDFGQLRDPWGMPYQPRFSVKGAEDVVEIVSNGPDKLPETGDDFTALTVTAPYFACLGKAIDSASQEYFLRTHKYVRDFPTLAQELKRRGIDLESAKDPWGHAYRYDFGVSQADYLIEVHSAGPDGKFTGNQLNSDDVTEWVSKIHYFRAETAALDQALAEHFRKTGKFPASEAELRPVLEMAGLSLPSLLDPWGHPYHFVFHEKADYADQVNISTYSVYGGEPQQVTDVVPVTQTLGYIDIVSCGPENDAARQFPVATFSRVIAEQSSKELAARKTSAAQLLFSGAAGAISGVITDPQGAVIANAKITAINEFSSQEYFATTDANGVYTLMNLPAGRYKVQATALGFQSRLIVGVPVSSSNLTHIDARLMVAAAAMTVEVAAAPVMLESATAQVSRQKKWIRVEPEQRAFTPRVRKYFPETLVWRPELVTNSSGHAQINFQMADNITTWKMSVIASTIEGKIGTGERELRTFQPFFVDHEPPKVLTQGDQILLPVVLRNYLKKPQQINVKLQPSSWFSLLSAGQQQVNVPAGQDAVAKFSISADHSVHEAKEHITAANAQTGDAVERTVKVHPDGEEVTQTTAALLSGAQDHFTVSIPANAIPGSIDAELKLYPGLASHVLDSLDGMVARPAGCAEQITSISFGSLLVLEVLRKAGQDDPDAAGNPTAGLARRARKYVEQGQQQLLALQAGDGGFPYWKGESPDAALTAYVLDFLVEASSFVNVSARTITRAQEFLISQQQADGTWHRQSYGGQADANLTAFAARVLAEASAHAAKGEDQARAAAAFDKAMKYLETRISEWNDPYQVGQYAIAASISGRQQYVSLAKDLLRQLAHKEGPGTYWNLEANTSPFYGWGYAGRLETTGLAVRALAHVSSHDDKEISGLLARGLFYLLNHKDRYGVWYSTQATVNILRGIIDALSSFTPTVHPATMAEVFINGKPAATVQLAPSNQISGPLAVELSSLLHPGQNQIEVRRKDDGAPLQAQVIDTHYVRWTESEATRQENFKAGESRALRLNVGFDHLQTRTGNSVQCIVQAERIGFKGYGMMLAEIGLPPGAEVDRQSLQEAMKSAGVSSYDVLPDRVVVYLWPKAGGTKFNFSFKPRFVMNASSAPSTLYDYYNPEAHATVAPVRFKVTE